MAAGVGGAAAGRNTYGYFGFFPDAMAAMKLAFDPRSTATIHAGLLPLRLRNAEFAPVLHG